jgi:hypothetical protein
LFSGCFNLNGKLRSYFSSIVLLASNAARKTVCCTGRPWASQASQTYIQLKLAVPAVPLHQLEHRPLLVLSSYFWSLFVMNLIELHLIDCTRLCDKCKPIGKCLVLQALKRSFFVVDNPAFEKCSSVRSRKSSDGGINLGLKLGGHGG